MTNEDKKYLAEWMRWRIGEGKKPLKEPYHAFGGEITHETVLYVQALLNTGDFFDYVELDKWNPDTNHEQFKKIWNKVINTPIYYTVESLMEWSELSEVAYDILFDLPKVMEAVMRVIKK